LIPDIVSEGQKGFVVADEKRLVGFCPPLSPVSSTMKVLLLMFFLAIPISHTNISSWYVAAAECITPVDCAMNGECIKGRDESDVQTPGRCSCLDGWKGDQCVILDLLPVDSNHYGLRLPNPDSSTWGGSVIYRDGFYHMFASEIINNCGLYSWTTNSQVIRAISSSPLGPYKKVQVIVPIFAHDANVIEAPTGELVLYITASKGVKPRDCRNSATSTRIATTTTTTSTRMSRRLNRKRRIRRSELFEDKNSTAPPKDTYMTWAPHPEGPWSEPVMVLDSTIWDSDYWARNHRIARCDSNLNGIILSTKHKTDDSTDVGHPFLGLWRRCETDDLLTIPHTLMASDWRNASSYVPNPEPLFVLAGYGAEDPSNIWTTTMRDGTTAYHTIFHDEQATRCMLGQCSASGRHAFSLDGRSWRYASEDAYQREVSFTDGRTITLDTRARPHIILDPQTGEPIALSTGVKETDESGYVWTMVQALRRPTET